MSTRGVTARMSRATIEILRDNLTLIPFVTAGGLAAAGFQVFLSRSLEKEIYGETFVVLGVLSVLGASTLVIQTVLARSSARLFALGRLADMRLAAWTAGRRLTIAAIVLTLILAALTPLLVRALQLTSPWPMLVAAVGAGLALVEPLFRGITQGARDFVAHGAVVAMHGFGRLGVGTVGVLAGGGSTGALLAGPGGALASIGMGVVALRRLLRGDSEPAHAASSGEPTWVHVRVGLIVTIMVAMLHLDGLAMRVFHPPDVAADYAVLAVIGRMVYWSGITIGLVLLPFVVQAATRGEDYLRAYLISVGLMVFAGSIVAVVVLLRPEFVYGVAFRDEYTLDTTLLPMYVAAAAMLAIATMTASLHIGASHLRVWIPLAVLVVATLVALAVAHESARQVVTVILVADAVAFVYLVGEAALLARRAPAPT